MIVEFDMGGSWTLNVISKYSVCSGYYIESMNNNFFVKVSVKTVLTFCFTFLLSSTILGNYFINIKKGFAKIKIFQSQ